MRLLRLLGSFMACIFYTIVLGIIGGIFNFFITAFTNHTLSASNPLILNDPITLVNANLPGIAIGAAIGLLIGISRIVRATTINRLQTSGIQLRLPIEYVEKQQRSRTTGSGSTQRTEWYTVYRASTTWQDRQTRQSYTFRSEFGYRKPHVGNYATIWYDPHNPSKHYMKY